jgi:predicted GIY-YIG superfamily endonuclease
MSAEQLSLIPEECRGSKKCEQYICYILRSEKVPARTYSGSSNHFTHRLRQHNGYITGGARATHTDRPWNVCCLVYGFLNRAAALRFEFFTKVKHSATTYKYTMSQGKNSLQRRAALLMAAELKMKPEQRRALKYFVPDSYMAECLRNARLEGVPGTMEAAWFAQKRIMVVDKDEKEELREEEDGNSDAGIQEEKASLGIQERPSSEKSAPSSGHSD